MSVRAQHLATQAGRGEKKRQQNNQSKGNKIVLVAICRLGCRRAGSQSEGLQYGSGKEVSMAISRVRSPFGGQTSGRAKGLRAALARSFAPYSGSVQVEQWLPLSGGWQSEAQLKPGAGL